MIPGDGWDIWAKLSSWRMTGIKDGSAPGPALSSFSLSQNYPNPFNSTTHIRYYLPAVSSQFSAVSLKIYNILGQEVRTLVDGEQAAGGYRILWDGKDTFGKEVSSGIYLYQLDAGGYKFTKKLVLLR